MHEVVRSVLDVFIRLPVFLVGTVIVDHDIGHTLLTVTQQGF